MQNTNNRQSTPDSLSRTAERKLLAFNVLVLLAIFVLIALFLAFGTRPTKSEQENRDLAKCPHFSIESYLNGTFTAEFAEFYNDTVPCRAFFKERISDFRASLGIEYDDGVKLHGNIPVQIEKPTDAPTEPPKATEPAETRPVAEDSEAEATEAPEETTEAPTEPPEEDINGEIANNILIIKDRGIMLYGGGFGTGQTYAETLNSYKAALGDGVNVYSLVAPTAVTFYLPEKYSDYSASEVDNIDNINSFLDGVQPVDAVAQLFPHKDEAIYSRTDHHWQPLGAYYAAEAFAQTAGVPFAPLSDYETVEREGYVGTLYGYTNDAVFKDNPEPFVFYKPENEYTTTYYNIDMTNEREGSLLLDPDNLSSSSWYLVFMGGDERITHITTDCKNGRVLMIIKDSYGNALVPCLTQSFEEIWVVDMRYFEPGVIPFAQEHGVTDLLFAMNTFSATGGNSAKLQNIMY